MVALCLYAFLFLVNAFAGKCSTKYGISHGKHTLESADGKRFYRIYVKGDSSILDVQTQSYYYDKIDIGDSVVYEVRTGLFTGGIIEQYNAHLITDK